MKKGLLILLCLPMIGFGQKTYVPNNGFEQVLINLGYDNVLDDSVLTANIDTLTYLDVNNQNIYDLTGIEDFTALTYLNLEQNQLAILDLSQNLALTYLDCQYNQLTSLDVSNNIALTYLNCSANYLLASLDVSNNTALTYLALQFNQLTSLNVSNNTALIELMCLNNQLTSLDVSNNTALTRLFCGDNNLTTLDVRNGNNTNLLWFWASPNTNLYCIDVDDQTWSTANWTMPGGWWGFDSQHYFSNNCSVAAFGCMDSLSCNYDSTATISNNSCVYLPVTINNTNVTCSNFSDASLEVIYNTGTYTFVWSNGATIQSIDSLPMGSYSVIITDTAGCSATLSANITLAPAPAFNMFPEICYVTVDSTTGNHKLVVNPMGNPLTSKVIIYKESSANVYNPIDTMNHNVLEYLDVSSNPMVQSYRYKVSVLDTCGNESAKSNSHKTIHLTMSLGINGEINLLWNTYEGYQPSDYLIFRSINNGSMSQIGILPGTNIAYTDLTPPTGNLNYQVRAIAPNCNIIPFAKNATNMLTSNVINHSTTAVEEHIANKKLLKVTDLLGRKTKGIKNEVLFYIYNDGTVEKKIIIE